MKAIISSSVFLPLSLIDARAVRKELTVAHWKMGEETAEHVQAWVDDRWAGFCARHETGR